MTYHKKGGFYVLPPSLCSEHRAAFIGRGNGILAFYSTISIVSKAGGDIIRRDELYGKYKSNTPFRLEELDGGFSMLNYGLFKKIFARAGIKLANQVFLMLYGNFEAYIIDMVLDSLTEQKCLSPYEEVLRLMSSSRWRGKMDRIAKKTGVPLTTSRFIAKFKGIEMEFLGDTIENPIEFLENIADFRHLLVHNSGRVTDNFIKKYPHANVTIGDQLQLPAGFPMNMQLYLTYLSGLVDDIFCSTFSWTQQEKSVEKLVII